MALRVTALLKNQFLFPNNINKYLKIFSDFKINSNLRCVSNTPKQSGEQAILRRSLPKNMSLWQCSPIHSSHPTKGTVYTGKRPLTLIFAWMLAKDRYLEKFRQLWFDRGFDVLLVQTSLLDAMFPPIGTQVVAQTLIKSLSELSTNYDEIVVHAFSVGGYQFGEVLVQLKREERHHNILNSIKGVVFDSLIYANDCASGVSKTMSTNPILQPMVQFSTKLFTKLYPNLMKHYKNSEDLVARYPPRKYPGLILYSKSDTISSFEENEDLVKNWTKYGNKISSKCWEQSNHILHYRYHQKEYEQELDAFITSLALKNRSIEQK